MRHATALTGLSAQDYPRHELHAPGRLWVEKNCYADIWIELLHALALEPLAMLSFTLNVDFLDDQWTFFKPPHEDLRELYGIDVQELYVWRPLLDHALEHLAAGRLLSAEADAHWLPDTRGTDYRRRHIKTTIILNDVDAQAGHLGYFHNAGYFELAGEDFTRLFRLQAPPDERDLPLFVELLDCRRLIRRPPAVLRQMAAAQLARAVRRLPERNPLQPFAARLSEEMPRLCRAGLDTYHRFAFGSLRQLGAAAELAALHLQWLEAGGSGPVLQAVAPLLRLSTLARTVLLKGARAVHQQRALAIEPLLEELAGCWEQATAVLRGCRVGEAAPA